MSAAVEWVSVSDAKMPLFAGVDVGGTSIKFGLVDDGGRTLGQHRIETAEERGLDDAILRMAEGLKHLVATTEAAWTDVAGVGLGTPGSMDIPGGLILEPPNMPHWRYFPIRDRLVEASGKPVTFANDANAAAFGEYWVGSGRASNSMVMFTLGTGVGGGIILNDLSLDGEHSFGSELGHIIIDQRPDARLCVWGGGRGQLEAYCSAPAIVARMKEELDRGKTSRVQPRLSRGERLTTLMMSEEAESGDPLCQEVILETARLLAIGIVTVVHTVDPGAVVLGGAVNFGGHATEMGRRFLARVQDEFHERAFHVVSENTVIEFASLGGDAGYIGAAGLARVASRRHRSQAEPG